MSKIVATWQRGNKKFRAVITPDNVSNVEVHSADNLGAECWLAASNPQMGDTELLRRVLWASIVSPPTPTDTIGATVYTVALGVLK